MSSNELSPIDFRDKIFPRIKDVCKQFANVNWGRNSLFHDTWRDSFLQQSSRWSYEIWTPVSPKPFDERITVCQNTYLVKVSLWKPKAIGAFVEHFMVRDLTLSEEEVRSFLNDYSGWGSVLQDYLTTRYLFDSKSRNFSKEHQLFHSIEDEDLQAYEKKKFPS